MKEVIHGYTVESDWILSSNGCWAKASKGGKLYFIKQFTNSAVEPDSSWIGIRYSEARYQKQLEEFNVFTKNRDSINRTLQSIDGNDSLLIPFDSFVYNHHYTEVSDFYSNTLSRDELLALPDDEKKQMILSLCKALAAVHSVGIVHGDLKLDNLLCTKNSIGGYVLKLFDFGDSYFEDDKPEDFTMYAGDTCYASPELGLVWMCEDEAAAADYIPKLTTKSDIFSLGVLIHTLLVGTHPIPVKIDFDEKFPGRNPSFIYPFEIILANGELVSSPEITDPIFRELIDQMLKQDPQERPTALEILDKLGIDRC